MILFHRLLNDAVSITDNMTLNDMTGWYLLMGVRDEVVVINCKLLSRNSSGLNGKLG